MELHKARELREAWGGKPCEHPHFDRERVLGAQTEDRVCTQCGEAFTPKEYEELTTTRTKQKAD